MIHEIDGVLCGRERNHKFEKNVPLMKSAIGECYNNITTKIYNAPLPRDSKRKAGEENQKIQKYR